MKTSQALQEMVTKLAAQHGLDLFAPEGYLGIDLGGKGRLEIEKIDEHLIRVIHYHKDKSEGDMVGEEFTCFISASGWIPIEKAQFTGVYIVYAEVSPDYHEVIEVDQQQQMELAVYVDAWVRELETETRLDQASKWEPHRLQQTQPPNLDTLIAWMDEGECEATDGCVVEPDGICPHGCQSWLIELGLI
jgi:hypothetical protein